MSFLRSQHKKPITTTAHSLRAYLGIFRDTNLSFPYFDRQRGHLLSPPLREDL